MKRRPLTHCVGIALLASTDPDYENSDHLPPRTDHRVFSFFDK